MMIALFILRRAATAVVLLMVLSFLVFGLLSVAPGTPLQTLIGPRPASPDLIASLESQYHLDEPFLAQYWHWLTNLLHFDFGRSISVQTDTDVQTLIGDRMAVSVELALYTIVLIVCVGVPLGMIAGIRRGRAADRGISLAATFAFSAPAFVVGLALLYLFGVQLRWFPVYGVGDGFTDRLSHLTLPAIAMAMFLGGVVVRQTRAAALTVMQQDYITFARARGLHPTRIFARYALRNSSLPVVTSTGLLLIAALSAAVLVEQVFSLPGIGTLLYNSVMQKDIPVVQGVAMTMGVFVVVVNLLVDLAVLALDPRARFSATGGE